MMQSAGPRVVLGSRVAVPIAGDFYAAATVQAVRNDVNGNEYVTVKFDDNNKGECRSSEIVGSGFRRICDIKLHKHQRVFITHYGKEVMAIVEEHKDGNVRLNLMNPDECINKREEEIRLTESRYSPRMHENHVPDYRKVASIKASPSHGRKRPVSDNIEVPQAQRARNRSTEMSMDELMAAMVLSTLSSSPVFHNPRSPTTRKADSPLSAASSGVGSWGQDARMSPIPGEPVSKMMSKPEDLTTGTPERSSVIQHTHSIEHSPSSTVDHIEIDDSDQPHSNEQMDAERASPSGVIPPGSSTPAPFQTGSPCIPFHPMQKPSPHSNPYSLKTSTKLEAVKEELDDKDRGHAPAENFYVNMSQQVLYIAPNMLPEYMVQLQSLNHQRHLHSAPDRPAAVFPHAPILSDRLPTSVTNVYAGSSPPTYYTVPIIGSPQLNSKLVFAQPRRDPSPLAARNDRRSTTTPPFHGPQSQPMRIPVMMKPPAQPINIPGVKAFSWHPTGTPQSYPSKPSVLAQRQHMHQAASPKMSFPMSPKALPHGRKVRGDGKKCRKVYGMENRDLWCTSCRWKKACQRFPD